MKVIKCYKYKEINIDLIIYKYVFDKNFENYVNNGLNLMLIFKCKFKGNI